MVLFICLIYLSNYSSISHYNYKFGIVLEFNYEINKLRNYISIVTSVAQNFISQE
jgi:hypothetical protein